MVSHGVASDPQDSPGFLTCIRDVRCADGVILCVVAVSERVASTVRGGVQRVRGGDQGAAGGWGGRPLQNPGETLSLWFQSKMLRYCGWDVLLNAGAFKCARGVDRKAKQSKGKHAQKDLFGDSEAQTVNKIPSREIQRAKVQRSMPCIPLQIGYSSILAGIRQQHVEVSLVSRACDSSNPTQELYQGVGQVQPPS